MYRNTGDIYVVADVLGHKDVNTTKKHYAAITDDIRRKAAVEISITDSEKTNKKTDSIGLFICFEKILHRFLCHDFNVFVSQPALEISRIRRFDGSVAAQFD